MSEHVNKQQSSYYYYYYYYDYSVIIFTVIVLFIEILSSFCNRGRFHPWHKLPSLIDTIRNCRCTKGWTKETIFFPLYRTKNFLCNIQLRFESVIDVYPHNLRGQRFISVFLDCLIFAIITNLEQFKYEKRIFNKVNNESDRFNCGMVPFADLRNNEP